MTGVKRLAALLVLLALATGAWLLMRPPPAADLLISGATIEDHGHGPMLTLTLANSGGPDRLTTVSSTSGAARIVSVEGVAQLPIPAGASPVLSEDGAYVALTAGAALKPGQLVPVTLGFEGAGPVTAQARVAEPDPMAMHHAHMGMVETPADQPAPTVALEVWSEGDGWALRVETENFTLNEDMADGPHVPGVGHAHLYLDGLKLQRLYSRDVHIGALPPGRYTVRVTLNANDHRVYMLGGAPITATAEIEAR